MKKVIMLPVLSILLALFNNTDGQILDKIKRKAEQKKNQKENEIVDKLFKKAEDPGKNKKSTDNGNTGAKPNQEISNPGKTTKKEIDLWSVRYDFLPGRKVLFYDDFEKEDVGEIPSKWKFLGGGMETVKINDTAKVMKWWDKDTRPNFKDNFVLPDQFTMEFDVYLEGPPRTGYDYYIRFYEKGRGALIASVTIGYGSMSVHTLTSQERVPDKKNEDFYNSWHHISLSYNNGSLKGYFDQYRLFNVRLEKSDIGHFSFYNCCTSSHNGHIFLMNNVRIAEGAHSKYKEEILAGGKIVSNNILFNYNSAQILPWSYAEIKRIADIMKEGQDMSFGIEGHTDSDGTDDFNLKLSKGRADAVKKALVDMGIPDSRLSTKGLGEAVPVTENATPEGKAMNRRVEFVKKV